MNTVELIAQGLASRGVQRVFGMPGGDTLPMVDALAEQGIDCILMRDESSAAFAADATAQLTGTPGVCIATLGPGLTNLISGVAGCLLDRAPVLALTSRYRSDRRGVYTHMMLDQAALMAPVSKAVFRVTAGGVAGELARALDIAHAPRPGPVWLEIPTEVAAAPTSAVPLRPPTGVSSPTPSQDLIDRIKIWRKPAILVGFAARHSPVNELARALHAPVLTSYKAKGALPEDQGWAAGAVGLSPVVDTLHRSLLESCDGLLLLGWDPVELRGHWLPGWSTGCEVVAVDAACPTDLPCHIDALHVGPIAPCTQALVAALTENASTWKSADVSAHRARWHRVFDEEVFGPATAIRSVQANLGAPDTLVTLDVGAHRITASNIWSCSKPDTLLQSNGFASMGYGLPAALAACATGQRAVSIIGDMGLQLTLGELGVAAEHKWPLTVVVLVDESLSLIELKQMRRKQPARFTRFANPEITSLARAFGGQGYVTRSSDDLSQAIQASDQDNGLSLIAAHIDPRPYTHQM